MKEDVIAHIRTRADRCRYLANLVNDARTADILRQMAREADADVERLEADQNRPSSNQQS